MKSEPESLSEFVNGLQRRARYSFARAEASRVLGSQPAALTKALQRLVNARRICQVQRGFYAIVPIEYESSGAPPTDWFIDDLMQERGQSYYVGVLSAAAIHGAAHQRPQEYQVVTPVSRGPIHAEHFRIRFFRYANMSNVSTVEHQGYAGMIPVSTPESTALDIVRFSKSIGGLDAVITILAELAEKIDHRALVAAAKGESVCGNVQRLGWLLDRSGNSEVAASLAAWLSRRNPSRAILNPSLGARSGRVCPKWQIIENDNPEGEL